ELVARLANVTRLSIDTETTSTRPRSAELVGVSLAWAEGEACYIPIRAPEGEPRIEAARALDLLRPLLENPLIEKVGQNLKYDLIVFRAAGVNVQGVAFDTMVADYLLEPGERIHNLDDLAERYLDHRTIKIEQLIGTGKKQKLMDSVPVSAITLYAAEDADVPLRISEALGRRLTRDGLDDLFRQLEMPLVEVLAELEYNGITVDVSVLKGLSTKYSARLDELRAEIYRAAGREFNIDSRLQLADILFNQLGLPSVKKTKTGQSTDAEVLEQLATKHELPAKLLEYRQLAKLVGTYIDALPELVHPATGRVHSSFKQDVAATGRLSSSDPNLQNIPVRTGAGREIRAAFRAGPPGWELVSADYSQIELRVLAHFSQDVALQTAFANDEDVHTRVASQVYGVSLADVTRDMRRSAKAINFGVIYGQSPFGLAKSLGIETDEAARFIDAYFAGYPGVAEFMEKVLDEACERGYVTTVLGRRRPVQGVRPRAKRGESRQRNLPERIAINTVIQGSAADVIKLAMVSLHGRLRQQNRAARMLLQIHDELVFEVAASERDDLIRLVVDEMTAAGRLSVPLKVDVKHGSTWADCDDA
ncbi:MAG TPA: DNA polymerase I, partial [Pirellulaceae bacterium]|nr:DNA polymerase I [Pirellulaceae bacterium]